MSTHKIYINIEQLPETAEYLEAVEISNKIYEELRKILFKVNTLIKNGKILKAKAFWALINCEDQLSFMRLIIYNQQPLKNVGYTTSLNEWKESSLIEIIQNELKYIINIFGQENYIEDLIEFYQSTPKLKYSIKNTMKHKNILIKKAEKQLSIYQPQM